MGIKGVVHKGSRLFAAVAAACWLITPGSVWASEVFYSFPMDSNPGWSTQGAWAFGQPLGVGGDPSSGYTGLNVYGYNLAGQYPNSLPATYLTTTVLDCSRRENVTLRFRRWLGIEYYIFDHATIEVSNDGVTWQTVWSHDGSGFTDGSWIEVSYDISAVADEQSTVYIRWGMGPTDGSVTYCGWNIDDVELLGDQTYFAEIQVNTPATVTEGDGLLTGAGEIVVSRAALTNVVIDLSLDLPGEIAVPESVEVPAGELSAVFDIDVLEDALVDGSQAVSITASRDLYIAGATTVSVQDNETATLSLAMPATTVEGAGTVAGTVQVSPAPDSDVVVQLISGNTNELLSGSVLVPAGQTLAFFTLPVVDDNLIDGIQSATVTAHVFNWVDGMASLLVIDNESTVLHLQLPESAQEGEGVLEGAGMVGVSGIGRSDIHVQLSASDTSAITVPVEAVIPAGQSNALFDITIVDDDIVEVGQTVSVVAASPGFVTTLDSMVVLDNEAHHLDMTGPTGDVARLDPVTITVAAKTVENLPANTFSNTVALSATGDRGAMVFTPGSLSNFVNGVASADVVFENVGFDVSLLADGGGIAGTSAVFNVIGPQLAITSDSLTNVLVVAGEFATRTMVISNIGNADLDFEIEGPGPGLPGPVAYYPFDGDAADASGNGYDGAVSGATPSEDRFGNPDQAFYFDGSAAITLPTAVMDFERTNSFSQSFWMKTTSPSTGPILSKINPSSPFNGINIYHTGGTLRTFLQGDSAGSRLDLSVSGTLDDGGWHHVALTYDGSSSAAGMAVYIDGVLQTASVSSDTLADTIRNAVAAKIGTDGFVYSYLGHLDDVRIYDRRLSEAEVLDLFNESGAIPEPAGIAVADAVASTPPETGLLAYYALDGDAADLSGNGYNGTLFGAAPMTNRFGDADSAFYFDGISDRIDLPSAVLNFERTDAFSQSFWMKSSDTDVGNNMIAKMQTSSSARGINVVLTSGILRFQLINYNTINNKLHVEGTTILNDDEWHHVVITYDGSSSASGVVVYVDGLLETTTVIRDSLTATILNTTTPTLGSRNTSSSYYYTGGLDDVRFYSRVLSAEEVEALQAENTSESTGVSWLVADPLKGTVPAASEWVVSLTYMASNMIAGDSSNTVLSLVCNDAASPTNTFEASMWVLPPAPVMAAEPEVTPGTSNEVAWSPVAGPVEYMVEMTESTNGPAVQQSGWMAATNHVFASLAFDTLYYYRARASVNTAIGLLEGPWSGWTGSTQLGETSDTDGDGMADLWELTHFGSLGIANALTDSDGDGRSDVHEFIAGTDPTGDSSFFAVYDVAYTTSGNYVVYWDAVSGRVYSVHWTSGLTNAFSPLAAGIHYPQGSYTDEVHQAEDQGFYKVGVELE